MSPSIIDTDICVVGGGSGGLSIAAGATQMGARVVLCERNKMGGDCLNYGCVPSKALIEAARHLQYINEAPLFGIQANKVHINFVNVHEHIKAVINTIAPHDSIERFESLGVKVIPHHATFVSPHRLQAGDTLINAKYIVIATGSRARIFPIAGLNQVDYLTNESMFSLTVCPKHLAIIGAGPIGCEIANAYRLLGADISLIEVAPQMLSMVDTDCVEILQQHFAHLGIELYENATIESIFQDKEHINIQLKDKTIQASHLLVATGRTPNIEMLNLDKATIEYSAKGIVVNKKMQSSQKHIYAIGDVASPYQFTHAAGYQASIVIQNILFKWKAKVNYDSFPWVIFTTPELAHTGMAIKEAGQIKGTQVLKLPFSEIDRAIASKKITGLIKVAVNKKGHILGVSIIGDNAGELITPWTLAIQNKLKIRHMASFIAPYPTLSELHKKIAGSYFTPKLYSQRTKKIVRFLLRYF